MRTGLKLPLHTYQRHALAWMSWRERIGGKAADDASFAVSSSQQDSADAEAGEVFRVGEGAVHPCWQPVTLPSGLHIYENRYTGHIPTTVLLQLGCFWLLCSRQARFSSLLQNGCNVLQVVTALSISNMALYNRLR